MVSCQAEQTRKSETHPVRGMGTQNFVYTKEKSRKHRATKISIPVPADLYQMTDF